MANRAETYESKDAHRERGFATAYHNIAISGEKQYGDDQYVPVRPNNPTRSPAFSLKEIPCKTAGRSGAYLISRFSTLMSESLLELEGQYAGTRLDSMTAGGS